MAHEEVLTYLQDVLDAINDIKVVLSDSPTDTTCLKMT